MRPLLVAVVTAVVLALAAPGPVAAAAPAGAPASLGLDLERLAGADRFATSVEISRASTAPGDIVYLASGVTFPDALAAGPVAAAEGAHLLLARTGSVDDVVMQRIAELAPREIVLVGAQASLATSVESQLTTAFPTTRITRIGGRDRVETSLLLLERLRSHTTVQEIWVVSGHDFPDALVAASVAGATRGAIVLDHHGRDPASAQAWAARVAPVLRGARVAIAGGTPSVTAADEAWLRQVAAHVERFAGSDRYETARLINDARRIDGGSGRLLVATGQSFPDALTGALLAASEREPLSLSPRTCHPTITPALGAAAAARGITSVVGLGSRATIVDDALALAPCPTFGPAQVAMGSRYGTLETARFSGTGDAQIRVSTASISYAFVQLEHLGSGTSEVSLYDSMGRYADRLFSGRGALLQTAVAPAGTMQSWDSIAIDIRTEGSWRLVVSDLRLVPDLPQRVSADGQRVFLYDGANVPCVYSSPIADVHGAGSLRQTSWGSYQMHTIDLTALSMWTHTSTCVVQGGLSWITARSDAPWELAIG